MTISKSFAKDIEKRLAEKGKDLSCLVCYSIHYGTMITTRSLPDIHEEDVIHEDMILEVSCKECGAMRFFNLNFFHGDGGILVKSEV